MNDCPLKKSEDGRTWECPICKIPLKVDPSDPPEGPRRNCAGLRDLPPEEWTECRFAILAPKTGRECWRECSHDETRAKNGDRLECTRRHCQDFCAYYQPKESQS